MIVQGYTPTAIITFIRNLPDATVPVHEGMDVDEEEVPRHYPHGEVLLLTECIEKAGIASRTGSGFSGTFIDFRI
jgi:hypothetical protein